MSSNPDDEAEIEARVRKAAINLNASRSALYSAIAGALDLWATIEAHLCSIFAVAVTAKDYSAAAAAFSAILSFEAQIDMVHAAMARAFAGNAQVYDEWLGLKKKLDKLRPIRNKLAHGKVVPVTMKGGSIEWRYLPFYHFFTHKERKDFVHLTVTDVGRIQQDFVNSIGQLSMFGKKIGAIQEIKNETVLYV